MGCALQENPHEGTSMLWRKYFSWFCRIWEAFEMKIYIELFVIILLN